MIEECNRTGGIEDCTVTRECKGQDTSVKGVISGNEEDVRIRTKEDCSRTRNTNEQKVTNK